MDQLKPGDVVKLKHSDNLMTVEKVASTGDDKLYNIDCVWFDFDNKLQRHCFRQETLELMS